MARGGGDGWRDRSVVVTGARGFIGSHLCERLSGLGAQVHRVSREAGTADPEGGWICADFAVASSAEDTLRRTRPDVVFHLAGHVTGSQDLANVGPTLLQNLTSTVNLMTAAVQTGLPRIVLAGSMQEPHADDPSCVPCSPYAASKWACGGYARMFSALYSLPVVIARPFMVYGPGQWDLTKLLPYTIVTLLRDETPSIGSGTRELDWVYVDDVVDGLLAVAGSSRTDSPVIDLGTGQATSVRTVVDTVTRLLGSGRAARYGAISDRPLERLHVARACDTTELLGWKASTPLQAGLLQTIDWYRHNFQGGTGGAGRSLPS